MGTRAARWARTLGLNAMIAILLLALVEGGSSLIIFGWRLFRPASSGEILAEALHSRYDPELGWVSLPDVEVLDLYGPGKHLRTNSRGFRKGEDIDPEEPVGRARVICSGDSFTLGYGVSNENAWCELLERLDARLQTVNMGQGGYGVDQAYLWFRRDAADLEHSVHLFAFVTEDFRRAAEPDLTGYSKPWLTVSSGELEVRNVPVPDRSPLAGTRREETRSTIRGLRVIELGRLAWGKLRPGSPDADTRPPETPEGSREVLQPAFERDEVARVFPVLLDSLVAINRRKGSLLALIHLPQEHELSEPELDQDYVYWRERLRAESAARDIPYLDLISDLRELPAHRITAMFIQKDISNLIGSALHYTEEGNALIAAEVHARLSEHPEFRAKLEPRSSPNDP